MTAGQGVGGSYTMKEPLELRSGDVVALGWGAWRTVVEVTVPTHPLAESAGYVVLRGCVWGTGKPWTQTVHGGDRVGVVGNVHDDAWLRPADAGTVDDDTKVVR